MAKTAASDVWKTAIKAEGNGWVDVVALMTDVAENWFKGQALQMGDDGAWIKYATGVAAVSYTHLTLPTTPYV